MLAWLEAERVQPQRKIDVSGIVPGVEGFLPSAIVTVMSWNQPLYLLLRPLIAAYAQEAAEGFWQRTVGEGLVEPPGPPSIGNAGLEEPRRPILEGGFDVINPKLNQAVDRLTLALCEETNQTTSKDLADALAQTREAVREGVVQGVAMDELRKRINAVFDQAEGWRAKRIAVTESSRAVHMAQELSATESGVVWGFQWLASGDACPLCEELAGKKVPLGTPFITGISTRAEYADVYYPPRHPNCQCTALEILTEDTAPAL